MAERVRDLPFHREEGHLATARLIVVTTLAGDWDEALALAGQFRDGWEQAGRPRAGNLSRGAYAAAAVHGLRGTVGWPRARGVEPMPVEFAIDEASYDTVKKAIALPARYRR